MTASEKIRRVEISGYKSIRDMKLDLESLNVLIGPNGSGKSNFLDFFEFMNAVPGRNLQAYVSARGGAEAFLHFGSARTAGIKACFSFGDRCYRVELVPTGDGQLVFGDESHEPCDRRTDGFPLREETDTGRGGEESGPGESESRMADFAAQRMNGWNIYHFRDMGDEASIRKPHSVFDNLRLRAGGENLAAFLFSIKDEPEYRTIVRTTQRAVPFFDDFVLEPEKDDADRICLRWRHQGADACLDARSLSPATLRFICLTTLLMQPAPPELILLDGPEPGIHPYVLELLAAMLRTASRRAQVIVSTQSTTFVNHFEWRDVVVVDFRDGESSFRRLEEEEVSLWLDDYRVGDLWEKNLFGGTP